MLATSCPLMHKIVQILLTRAESNSIGMSPIGGLVRPVFAEDDQGLLVKLDITRRFERRIPGSNPGRAI